MLFRDFAIGFPILVLVMCVLISFARRGTCLGWGLSFKRDGVIGILSLLAVVGTVVVLALTALWPRLSVDQAMTSYGLMVHVGCGGAFIVSLTVLTALWGRRHHVGGGVGCGRRVLFWLLGTAGLGAALTMFISMTPLFGTGVQHLLFGWHRILGVIVLAAALGYFYLGLTGRRGESAIEKV